MYLQKYMINLYYLWRYIRKITVDPRFVEVIKNITINKAFSCKSVHQNNCFFKKLSDYSFCLNNRMQIELDETNFVSNMSGPS